MQTRGTQLRTQLAHAAARLREVDSPDLAEAVEEVLKPTGWGLLRRSSPEVSGSGHADRLPPNLPVRMPKAVREEIKRNVAAAQAAKPGVKITLATEAERALEAFLAGEFAPEQPQRLPRGAKVEWANLNVRVDAELRQRAEDFGADNAAEFGFAPRASHIISSWLIQRFTEAGS